MRLSLFSFIVFLYLLAPLGVHAAPERTADEMDTLLIEKGFLGKVDRVGKAVGDQAAALVFNAMGFLGVPYRRGGNSAETGFDCSGFVKAIYEQTMGLVLPRRAAQQAAATQNIDQQELQPGDLVFFNTMRRAFSHVGIYIGDGKFIHSPRPGSQVRIDHIDTTYWSRRFDGARRVNTEGLTPTSSNAKTATPTPIPATNRSPSNYYFENQQLPPP